MKTRLRTIDWNHEGTKAQRSNGHKGHTEHRKALKYAFAFCRVGGGSCDGVPCEWVRGENGYLRCRLRDAGDVAAFSVGAGMGAKVRVGPIHAGLLRQVDLLGFRYGSALTPLGDQEEMDYYDIDVTLRCGESSVRVMDEERTSWPSREYPVRVLFRRSPTASSRDGRARPIRLSPRSTATRATSATPCSIPTTPNASSCIGLLGTIRLGLNPGELIDFLLGWSTVDIFDDDRPLEDKKRAIEGL